jgi:hypothetical protein
VEAPASAAHNAIFRGGALIALGLASAFSDAKSKWL